MGVAEEEELVVGQTHSWQERFLLTRSLSVYPPPVCLHTHTPTTQTPRFFFTSLSSQNQTASSTPIHSYTCQSTHTQAHRLDTLPRYAHNAHTHTHRHTSAHSHC